MDRQQRHHLLMVNRPSHQRKNNDKFEPVVVQSEEGEGVAVMWYLQSSAPLVVTVSQPSRHPVPQPTNSKSDKSALPSSEIELGLGYDWLLFSIIPIDLTRRHSMVLSLSLNIIKVDRLLLALYCNYTSQYVHCSTVPQGFEAVCTMPQ